MLAVDTFLALVSFAFVTSITPGPNNIMVTASGVNFGFARTIPHMLGIWAGFSLMQLIVGFGLGAVFAASPAAQTALKIVGAAYMVWLAWKIANAGPAGDGGPAQARPMNVLEAALFQAVNPKAWILAFSAMALYVRPDHAAGDMLQVIAVFGLVGFPCVAIWTGFGHGLRNVLRDAAKVRVFNIIMAALLVASIVPMVVT
jgi:threonine/homoserine/homoserine lactone efflux protein